MFVQIQTAGCFTVGHYEPDGTWIPHSDYATSDEADKKVAQLNGGTVSDPPETVNPVLAALARFLHPAPGAATWPHDALVWAMFAQGCLLLGSIMSSYEAAMRADELLKEYRARLQEGKFNG